MLATVNGYYDGSQVVIEESEKKYLRLGDRLTITIVNQPSPVETRSAKRKNIISSGEYVMPTGITANAVEDYLRASRSDR